MSEQSTITEEQVQRAREARHDIPERHIMVAGDDQHRAGQAIEEGSRGAELARTRALREIAAHRDEARRARPQLGEERLRDRRVLLPEVQVRDVGYGAHGPLGTITRSARGRTR